MCNTEWSIESSSLRLPEDFLANCGKGPSISIFWQAHCSALYRETSKKKSISSYTCFQPQRKVTILVSDFPHIPSLPCWQQRTNVITMPNKKALSMWVYSKEFLKVSSSYIVKTHFRLFADFLSDSRLQLRLWTLQWLTAVTLLKIGSCETRLIVILL